MQETIQRSVDKNEKIFDSSCRRYDIISREKR